MTKNDFQFIADIINDCGAELGWIETQAKVANKFADALKQTNPRFNREKFLEACGVYND